MLKSKNSLAAGSFTADKVAQLPIPREKHSFVNKSYPEKVVHIATVFQLFKTVSIPKYIYFVFELLDILGYLHNFALEAQVHT